MSILHKYIFRQLVANFVVSLTVLVTLFAVFDFFERIDNIVAEDAGLLLTAHYFLLKIPLMVSLMLPVAVMVATLFTLGVLSKNSEITAMRAAGLRVRWIIAPVLLFGFFLGLVGVGLNETVVPYSQQRQREIYNIDIRQKDKRGGFSQADFWWRTGNTFYAARIFDSRSRSLFGFTALLLNDDFSVHERVDAQKVPFVNPILGWTMLGVNRYRFSADPVTPSLEVLSGLPLPMKKTPSDFYDIQTDPHTMSFRELKKFVVQQQHNGLATAGYLAYLYEKIAFPFVAAVLPLIIIPFALLAARKGSMAPSIIASLLIAFSYYAVHSFSVAMGRAELIPPLLSAWLANIILGSIGLILLSGTEAPR